MEPKLMNCCKPQPMGTQGYGKMLKIIQVLEDGRVPAKEARNWRIEGQKRRITRKEYQRLLNKLEMEGFMAQKGSWNLATEKILRERGALHKEVVDAIREYKAMHEENFLSSWLREDGREEEERTAKVNEENEEEWREKRKTEEEKEENKTVTVKRRCDGFVFVEAFENFGQVETWRIVVIFLWKTSGAKPEDLSDRESEAWVVAPGVLDVTDVPVSTFCGH